MRLGIGDDAAVWKPSPGKLQVITVDEATEGTDFRRSTSSLEDAGWRALAASLSDVAAMGGRPLLAVVSLTIPRDLDEQGVVALYRGMNELARRHRVTIAGGDLSRGAILSLGVTAVGEVRPSNLKRRDGGLPGDVVAVTGPLGASRAGLAILDGQVDPAALDPVLVARAVEAHRRPVPRVEAGHALGGSREVRALMDLSDGLAADLPRLAAASGVAAVIEEAALPIDAACRAVALAMGVAPARLALEGGDDLELLCAVRGRAFEHLAERVRARVGRPLLRVGRLEAGDSVTLERAGERHPLDVSGWEALRP
ncbi:MAG TPA: thiamine-phosphate kinase [Candidatus Dormibacteraeota bacterium]|nr:thiamine-phosphate kinase [Candidatus Dormibacteraeota bacterium]